MVTQPETGGRERRAHPRAEADWNVTLKLEDGEHHARLRDVSRNGVCLFIDRPVREMSLLGISLEWAGPQGPRALTAHGAVVRCEQIAGGVEHYEVAVFLHEMDDRDRECLDEYVAATLGSATPE